MLGNLGPMELFIILVIVLVVFGAKRVPEIGASIGKGIREFKRNISDVDRQIREPDRDARAERLNAGEPAAQQRREEDATSEPKRLIS
jgi:sec-independent protein translocase protein TatA